MDRHPVRRVALNPASGVGRGGGCRCREGHSVVIALIGLCCDPLAIALTATASAFNSDAGLSPPDDDYSLSLGALSFQCPASRVMTRLDFLNKYPTPSFVA